jgi:hypothetical protein
MSRRAARITQAEIERVIRAAMKTGIAEVEVKIGEDASIRISLAPAKPIAESDEVVL